MLRLIRGQAGVGEASWDVAAGHIDRSALSGVEAAVHLAGEPIASHRWSTGQRHRILHSRLEGTRLLAGALAGLDPAPAVLVSGSAVGFYGDRGDEILDEDSGPGDGFLAEVCRAWEAATRPAEQAGIRVVHLRSGMVLSARGGALGRQLPLFRAGLGGHLGSGRQHVSWIHLEDEVGAILHALDQAALEGPLNATAPFPVTNREMTAALGRAVRRPTVLSVPATVLSVVLGRQMAEELLLVSQRVVPVGLQSSGYVHRRGDLDGALACAVAR